MAGNSSQSNQTNDSNQREAKPDSNSQEPTPNQSGRADTFAKDFVLSLAVVLCSVLVVMALAFLIDQVRPGQFGSKAILVCGSIFLFSHGTAALFQFFPKGNEMALFRLGMVAFCRTVLPLVVLMLLEYNGRLEQAPNWGLLALLLFVVPWATGTAWLFAASHRM